jgi:hypothetical protein
MQNDAAMEQVPDAQSDEQHSELAAHVLPAVLHDVLSALQVPPVHEPPQHCPFVVHAWPSDVQVVAVQAPATQESEQQSTELEHAAPDLMQLIGAPPRHAFVRGSHCAEQQSLSPAQCAPTAAHAFAPLAPLPECDELPQPPAATSAATKSSPDATTKPDTLVRIATATSNHGAMRAKSSETAIARKIPHRAQTQRRHTRSPRLPPRAPMPVVQDRGLKVWN